MARGQASTELAAAAEWRRKQASALLQLRKDYVEEVSFLTAALNGQPSPTA